MAALAIPLITTLVPVAIPLLVRLVDRLFGAKTGAVKFQSVVAAVLVIVQGLVSTGQITQAQAPDANAIQAMVQAVVDELNAKGELQGLGTVVTPAPTLAVADARSMLRMLEAIAPILGVK